MNKKQEQVSSGAPEKMPPVDKWKKCRKDYIKWHGFVYDYVNEGRLLGRKGRELCPSSQQIERVLTLIDSELDLNKAMMPVPCYACTKDGDISTIAGIIADWYSACAFLDFLHNTEKERTQLKVFNQSVEKVSARVRELDKQLAALK